MPKPREPMPENVQKLSERLRSDDDRERVRAVEEAEGIKHPSIIPVLAEALRKNTNYIVRGVAARTLGNIGHPDAIPALAKALKDDFDLDVRLIAAGALGKIKHKTVVTPLAKVLLDNEFKVGIAAAGALGNAGPRAIPHLVKILGPPHQHFELRAATVRALRKISHALQTETARTKEAKALQLVGPYFHEDEHPQVARKAYEAALAGKITPANARLYIKQLRAVKGNLK